MPSSSPIAGCSLIGLPPPSHRRQLLPLLGIWPWGRRQELSWWRGGFQRAILSWIPKENGSPSAACLYLSSTTWIILPVALCSGVEGLCPLNCQDDNVNCFLIDNNGFILVSKVSKQTGKFFGEVDGSVMSQLINMGMFKQVKMYDYQAMCKMPHHHHSGARPLLSPIYAILATVRWLISDFLIFLLEFNMSSFWHSDNLADAHKHKKHDTLQPCDTEYPIFVYEPAIKETNGIIDCGDCQKMFVVQQIMNSNLLLLVTDAVCDCKIFPPVLLQPKEVKYNASVKCDRMRSQKLRRRPDTCHAFHAEENAEDCGGAAEISTSLTLLLLCLGTTVLLR